MERIPATKPVGDILLAIALLAIAGILSFRRLFVPPFDNLPAAETALYSAVFASAVGFASNRLVRTLPASIPAHAAPSLTFLVSLAFAASLSADPFDALASLLAIATAIGIPLVVEWKNSAAQPVPMATDRSIPNEIPSDPPPPPLTLHGDDALDSDANLAQSLTRRTTGADCHIEGMLTFELPAGQIVHQLHVPFWPTLPAAPTVECEIDELDARVRVPLAAPHGLRIEVRAVLASEEPRAGILHFTAHATPARAA